MSSDIVLCKFLCTVGINPKMGDKCISQVIAVATCFRVEMICRQKSFAGRRLETVVHA